MLKPVYNNHPPKDNFAAAMPLMRTLSLVVVTCLWSCPHWCQETLQDRITSAYQGKTFLLRNFSAGSDLHYDQNGTLIGSANRSSWTLANVQIKGVTLTSQGIEIAGKRLGRVFKGPGRGFRDIGKVKIHVALPGAQTAKQADLDSVMSKIFIGTGEDLRPMLPDCWRYFLAGNDSASRIAAWDADFAKDTYQGAGATAPKPLNTPDPNYTKEAASQRIEGVTVVRMVISASGTAESAAIVDPLGMGLDDQAVAAVNHWKFAPSTVKGQPVPVRMNVEISFRCCGRYLP